MNEHQQIIREEFFLTSDPGIQIFVREVRGGQTQPMRKGPVLLLHGARVPGIASFDLDVPNASLAADLASNGHIAYVMDARGYGKSSRPREMEQPPKENPPLARSSEVVRDILSVVEWIRQRLDVRQVALLGWATGGHWHGYYTALASMKQLMEPTVSTRLTRSCHPGIRVFHLRRKRSGATQPLLRHMLPPQWQVIRPARRERRRAFVRPTGRWRIASISPLVVNCGTPRSFVCRPSS